MESAGFPRSLQNLLLPEWVAPDVLSDAAVSSEIAAILAKRLGLRASSVHSTTNLDGHYEIGHFYSTKRGQNDGTGGSVELKLHFSGIDRP